MESSGHIPLLSFSSPSWSHLSLALAGDPGDFDAGRVTGANLRRLRRGLSRRRAWQLRSHQGRRVLRLPGAMPRFTVRGGGDAIHQTEWEEKM